MNESARNLHEDISRQIWLLAGVGLFTFGLLVSSLLLMVSPLYAALVFLSICGFLACAALFGVSGSMAVIPVAISFLLMIRFDEGLAIPIGAETKIKASYWAPMLMLAALAVYVALRRSGSGLGRPRILILLVCFGITGLASIFFNQLLDPWVKDRSAVAELLALGIIVLPPFFAVLLPQAPLGILRTTLCMRCLVGFGGLAGFVMSMFGLLPDGVISALGWTGATSGTVDLVRGRLPLGHPNTVAAVMLLLLPPSIILGLGDRNWLWRVFYIGCAGLMFCGTLFALSRGALLCMTLTLLLSLAYLWTTWRGFHKVFGLLVAGLFGVALIVVAAFLFSKLDFSRFWSRGYHEEASVERRISSMTTAVHVWKDHPLLGVAPGAVYTRLELHPDWIPPDFDRISPIIYYRGRITAETPHNFYLTVLAEFGLLGALFWFGLLGAVLLRLWRAQRGPGVTLQHRRTLTAFMIGICAFLMIGMFEAVLMTGVRANIVFWIYAGIALRYAEFGFQGWSQDLPPAPAAIAASDGMEG